MELPQASTLPPDLAAPVYISFLPLSVWVSPSCLCEHLSPAFDLTLVFVPESHPVKPVSSSSNGMNHASVSVSHFSFSTRPPLNFCYLSPPLPHTIITVLGVCPVCCSVLWSQWGLNWELHGVFIPYFSARVCHTSAPCVFIAFWHWCFSPQPFNRAVMVAVATALRKPSVPTITDMPPAAASWAVHFCCVRFAGASSTPPAFL